jgi:Tfp pilus assembly protein PilF
MMATSPTLHDVSPLPFDAAFARYEGGEREELLPGLTAAVRAATLDPRLWHLHGLVLRELERHAEALPSLRRAAEIAPQSVKIAHALARTLYEAGLSSVDAYVRAVRLAPGEPDLVSGLAAALTAEGRISDAIAGLERSLSFTPQWVHGHATLANLRWIEGERHGFARSFDEALSKLPQSVDLRRQQIVTLVHAQHWDDALAAIAAGRQAIGDNLMFDGHEATILSEMGDLAAAAEKFARLAEVQDPGVQVGHVRNLLRLNRAFEASAVIDPWLTTAHAREFWTYAATAWRMTRDPRSHWLEGDPRFVGVYDIADRLPPLTELADTLRRLHNFRGEHLDQSVRGGTQSDGNLFFHVDPVIVRLREAIRAVVAEHVAQLPQRDELHPLLSAARDSIRFNGAWSVRLTGGGFHTNHVHPYGWISSALYVVLPQDIGQAQAGFLTLGQPQAELKLDLPPTKVIEPKSGRLALFPSWMWHGTRPFGAGERITVAFDVAHPSSIA